MKAFENEYDSYAMKIKGIESFKWGLQKYNNVYQWKSKLRH